MHSTPPFLSGLVLQVRTLHIDEAITQCKLVPHKAAKYVVEVRLLRFGMFPSAVHPQQSGHLSLTRLSNLATAEWTKVVGLPHIVHCTLL